MLHNRGKSRARGDCDVIMGVAFIFVYLRQPDHNTDKLTIVLCEKRANKFCPDNSLLRSWL
jgi:hypothetical protein